MAGPVVVAGWVAIGVRAGGKIIVSLLRRELRKGVTERLEELMRQEFNRQLQEIEKRNPHSSAEVLTDTSARAVVPPMWLRDP